MGPGPARIVGSPARRPNHNRAQLFRYTSLVARSHRDAFGSILGILVFLAGISLLGVTFDLAYKLYTVPPEQALKLNGQKAIDLAATGGSFVGILVKTILLIVMGFVSSLIANRGIHLYSHSLMARPSGPIANKDEPDVKV